MPGAGYCTISGTSNQAAPHVAGAFALLKNAKLDASVSEIIASLARTGKAVQRGHVPKPRIDVLAASESPAKTPLTAVKNLGLHLRDRGERMDAAHGNLEGLRGILRARPVRDRA